MHSTNTALETAKPVPSNLSMVNSKGNSITFTLQSVKFYLLIDAAMMSLSRALLPFSPSFELPKQLD